MTAGVIVDNKDIIIYSAPIFGKFIGQPLKNLVLWSSRKLNLISIQCLGKEECG